MSVLIYAVGNLVAFVIFIGITVSPAVGAYFLGKRLRAPYLRWLPLVLVIVVPLAWGAASYSTFKRMCQAVPSPVFLVAPRTKVDGFLLKGRHIYGNSLIERGAFQFVEEPLNETKLRRDFAGQKKDVRSPVPVQTEFVSSTSSKSEYVVIESSPKRLSFWWQPPIFRYELEVRERKSGDLMAKASDLVFGGGVAGTYMRALRGDQDFEHVSCGYASKDVDAWRPSLTSRPRFAEYLEADRRFLTKALCPA